MGKRQRNRKRRSLVEGAGRSSPYPASAHDFEFKMLRSGIHLNGLKAEIDAWIKAAMETLVEEPEPDDPGYFATWIAPPTLDLASVTLVAGDALQCLRSALDHLAFELAAAFAPTMTDEIEESSEFPILSDRDRSGKSGAGRRKWDSVRQKKVGAMDPLAQAEIERLQPYHRGDRYVSDPLWRLSVLNNVDKHRSLHVVASAVVGTMLPVNGPALPRHLWSTNVAAIGLASGDPFVIESGGVIQEVGRTQVARWPMLPIDPSKKMHMNFRPQLDVSFGPDTPLVAGESVVGTISDLYNYVLTYVFPPLVGFLK